jgi:hypothetical protein
MTSLNLLVRFGYLPYTIYSLFTHIEFSLNYLAALVQSDNLNQLFCLMGGFLWLAATLSYSRKSAGACLYCGRQDGAEDWSSAVRVARWGRTAVYVGLIAPVFYAVTRYAWGLGIPLGMNVDQFQAMNASGIWILGVFLATFGLVGAFLMFGLIKPWGEVFPHWLPGLAGRRVPMALALIPSALVAVLLVVGGIGIALDMPSMIGYLAAEGEPALNIAVESFFQVGPALLFPVWGCALAAAALAYYYRRRGACHMCGRRAA